MTKSGLCCEVAVAGWLALIFSFAAQAAPFELAATGSSDPAAMSNDDETKKLSPEQRMQTWFPQPAKIGHLIGLPVLDGKDSTIGYVQTIFRTADGKIRLIVPYKDRFGWARDGTWLAGGGRPVAVPIESVQLLALQINAVDMDRDAFKNAPTWNPAQSTMLAPEDVIRIGIGRR